MGSTVMKETDQLSAASHVPTSRRSDLLVLGAGPAGLSVARSAARLGLSVTVAAPRPERRWTNNFGAWADELAGLEDIEAVSHRFPAPAVWLGDRPLRLDRTYVRLDTEALQRQLLVGCRHAGVTFVDARAQGVEHHERASVVSFDGGVRLDASTVVDATGYGSRFIERADRREPAFQSAYGELVDVESHPYEPGTMALMDYRPISGAQDAPTFLYAIPLSPTRLFVEETSLVGRPAMSHPQLRARLGLRLASLGIRIRKRHERELCLIPMGTPLPRRDQRTIAFGAAASLVHPATGYQIARTLRLAPAVAAAIAEGLARHPATASARAYQTCWPDERLRAWELYTFGMDFLAGLDRPSTVSFLEAFFQLPKAEWHGFMTGELRSAAICGAMLGVFRRAAFPLKSRLLRAGTGSGSKALLRAALPHNPS